MQLNGLKGQLSSRDAQEALRLQARRESQHIADTTARLMVRLKELDKHSHEVDYELSKLHVAADMFRSCGDADMARECTERAERLHLDSRRLRDESDSLRTHLEEAQDYMRRLHGEMALQDARMTVAAMPAGPATPAVLRTVELLQQLQRQGFTLQTRKRFAFLSRTKWQEASPEQGAQNLEKAGPGQFRMQDARGRITEVNSVKQLRDMHTFCVTGRTETLRQATLASGLRQLQSRGAKMTLALAGGPTAVDAYSAWRVLADAPDTLATIQLNQRSYRATAADTPLVAFFEGVGEAPAGLERPPHAHAMRQLIEAGFHIAEPLQAYRNWNDRPVEVSMHMHGKAFRLRSIAAHDVEPEMQADVQTRARNAGRMVSCLGPDEAARVWTQWESVPLPIQSECAAALEALHAAVEGDVDATRLLWQKYLDGRQHDAHFQQDASDITRLARSVSPPSFEAVWPEIQAQAAAARSETMETIELLHEACEDKSATAAIWQLVKGHQPDADFFDRIGAVLNLGRAVGFTEAAEVFPHLGMDATHDERVDLYTVAHMLGGDRSAALPIFEAFRKTAAQPQPTAVDSTTERAPGERAAGAQRPAVGGPGL